MSSELKALNARAPNTFSVSGLLNAKSEVFYINLFNTRHVGRISDLLAARLEKTGIDVFALRMSVLLPIFESCQALATKETPFREVAVSDFPEPLSLECGLDGDKVAVGVSFTLKESFKFDPQGLSKRVADKRPNNPFEDILCNLVEKCHLVIVRFHPPSRKFEVVALLNLDQKAEMGLAPMEVMIFDQPSVKPAPKPLSYVNLGDVDYPTLLQEREPRRSKVKDPFEVLEPGQEEDYDSESLEVEDSESNEDEEDDEEKSQGKKSKGFFAGLFGDSRSKVEKKKKRAQKDSDFGVSEASDFDPAEFSQSEDLDLGDEDSDETDEVSGEGAELSPEALERKRRLKQTKRRLKKMKAEAGQGDEENAEESVKGQAEATVQGIDGKKSDQEGTAVAPKSEDAGDAGDAGDAEDAPDSEIDEEFEEAERKRKVKSKKKKKGFFKSLFGRNDADEGSEEFDERSETEEGDEDDEATEAQTVSGSKANKKTLVKGRKAKDLEEKQLVRGKAGDLLDQSEIHVEGDETEEEEEFTVSGGGDLGSEESKLVKGAKAKRPKKKKVRSTLESEEEAVEEEFNEETEEEEFKDEERVLGGPKERRIRLGNKYKPAQTGPVVTTRIKNVTENIKDDVVVLKGDEKPTEYIEVVHEDSYQNKENTEGSLWDRAGQAVRGLFSRLGRRKKRGRGGLGRSDLLKESTSNIPGDFPSNEVIEGASLSATPASAAPSAAGVGQAQAPAAPSGAPGAEAAEAPPVPEPDKNPDDQSDLRAMDGPDAASLEHESRKLLGELQGGGLDQVLRVAQWEALSIKKDIKNPKANKWVDNLIGTMISERSRLHDMAKKVNLAVRLKDMEHREQISLLQEEIRKKDVTIGQKTTALVRAREQAAKTNEALEKFKSMASESSDDGHYKQKYEMASKMLSVSKDENLHLNQRLEELRNQAIAAASAAAAAKQSGPSPAQYSLLKNKYEVLYKQQEELKKTNRALMDRLNDAKKEQRQVPSGAVEESRRRLEAAMKVVSIEKQEKELLKNRYVAIQIEQSKLKDEVRRLQSENRRLIEALQNRKPTGSGGTGPGTIGSGSSGAAGGAAPSGRSASSDPSGKSSGTPPKAA